MKKIGLEALANAKAAESTLKREEVRGLTAALPPGHPLEQAVAQAESETNGDLAGMPDNHPLMQELRAAKERYEQEGVEEEVDEREEAQKKAREVRKAKKVSRTEARRKQTEKEDVESKEQRQAASAVNKDMDVAISAIRNLHGTLEAQEGTLVRHRMNSGRTARLKRLLLALERGLAETKMSRV